MKEKKIWQDFLLLRSVCPGFSCWDPERPQQGMLVPQDAGFQGAVQSWGEGVFVEMASGYFCLN